MRKLVVLAAMFAALFVAPTVADAAIPSALGITCTTQGGQYSGQRWCGTGAYKQSPADNRSTVKTFDGVPIDVNVAFPPSTGGDGPYPLVMMFHGYGGGKIDFPGMQRWLDKGYAVFSMTNRGFHESCGTPAAKAADPICVTKGFVRLDDTRYEVRDAQYFSGMLVDEGLVKPHRIAATGGSYGGGLSMSLAALNNRTMLPDGSLVPWTSPGGTPMSLAVAIPSVPWTDLAYSLAPNGSNYDYIRNAAYTGRFGVMKQSFVNGLYLAGITSGEGYYTPPGEQPSADLTGWKAFMDAGEPYDSNPEAARMLSEIQNYHSSYYIDHSTSPAPLLISSGLTDDLFPANEATRFYNRTRAQYPNSPLSLMFGDFGHQRAQNKADVSEAVYTKENAWVDYYLGGTGSQPPSNVTVYTQTCPANAPSGGPFVSKDWASASPGEIRLDDAATQTIAPDGGSAAVGAIFNPAPSGTACASADGAREPGTANYEMKPAPAGGFTVLGSPTVIARISQAGDNSQIAARLVDVSPDGSSKTLVDRALWRPANSGFQVFQLNPGAWKVKAGHVLRLELLPKDAGGSQAALLSNYGRPSDGQQPATISDLELRVPVLQTPGALDGLVKKPAAKVLPDVKGVQLAPGYESIGSETLTDYASRVAPCPEGTTGTTPPDCTRIPVVGNLKPIGKPKVKGKKMKLKVRCAAVNDSCRKATIKVRATGKVRGRKKPMLARGKGIKVGSGKTRTVRLKLTHKARKIFGNHKKTVRRHGHKKKKTVKGVRKVRAKIMINGTKAATRTVKRVGRVR